jgi:hypothetical protein
MEFILTTLLMFTVLFGLSIVFGKLRSKKQDKVITEVMNRGKRTTGRIIAVKTFSARRRHSVIDRADLLLLVRLEYRDPYTGRTSLAHHVFSMNLSNVPREIKSIGSLVTDVGDVRNYIGEVMAYRKELEAQGYAKSDVDQMVMAHAQERTTGAIVGEEEEYGYVNLAKPVDVTVYLHKLAPSGDGIYIVFPEADDAL